MLVYDLEIVKAIPDRNGAKVTGIEYCAGWHDHATMGISCLCAYDLDADRWRVFCADNLSEFQKAVDASDFVVGFNNRSFDDKVVAAHGITIPPEKSYDILVEIWAAHGLGPKFVYPSHAGYGLDPTIKCNFPGLAAKTGHGELAPVQWQQGKVGAVIDYCLQDVKLTKILLGQIICFEEIVSPKTGQKMKIRKPYPSAEVPITAKQAGLVKEKDGKSVSAADLPF